MDANLMSYLERRQQQQPPGQPPMLVGAVPPPPGVTANFINPEMAYPLRTGQTILGVGISIAGLFILMRIYTKARILRNFGAEDVSIILSFIFTVACCIISLKGADYGTGKHIWDIPAQVFIPKWGQIVVAATVIYCPAMMFAKLAILICYLRISPQKTFHYAVYGAMFITVAYNVSLMLALIFGCSPIQKAWDLRIQTGSCINRPAVYLSNAILNVATDFMILLLPVPMIRALKMPFRQKLLVGAMFSVGSLACIIGIVRLKTLIPTLHDPDATWAIAVPGLWVVVEINLAVACGCLSVIRPFLRHHFPLLLGETRKSRPYSSSYERYRKAKPSDYFSSTSSNSKHLNMNLPPATQWARGARPYSDPTHPAMLYDKDDPDGIPLSTHPLGGMGKGAGVGGTMGLGMHKSLEPDIFAAKQRRLSDGGESGLGNRSYVTSATNTRSSTPPPIYTHASHKDKEMPPLPRGSNELRATPTPPGQVLQLQGLPEEELRGTMSEREKKALGRLGVGRADKGRIERDEREHRHHGHGHAHGPSVETTVSAGKAAGKDKGGKEGRRSDERGREKEAREREKAAKRGGGIPAHMDVVQANYEGHDGILRTVDVGVDIERVGSRR